MDNQSILSQHKDYKTHLPQWVLANDACAGEYAVKAKKTEYLPRTNPLDMSSEATTRYEQYLKRAVYYNASGRTLAGLVGSVFRKNPVIKLPSVMDDYIDDIDGNGLSLYQQAQYTVANVLKKGRHCLYVDYPAIDAPVSKADQDAGLIRPSICSIDAENVIDWRVERFGSISKLSFVKIKEMKKFYTEFSTEEVEQIRILRLGEFYSVEVYQRIVNKDSGKEEWALVEGPYFPTDGKGNLWNEIPFVFTGAQNNDPEVDKAPMLDICTLNIAHYRNSAENEHMLFWCSMPQAVMTGLDENWRDHLEKKGISIGGGAVLPLPQGGDFKFAQVTSDQAIAGELKDKEKRLVSLGALIIEQGYVEKSATQVQGERESDYSQLTVVSLNVSEAYESCLEWMAKFLGLEGEIEFHLNTQFVKPELDSSSITALVQAWQAGRLPSSDLWNKFREYGIIDHEKTDEEVQAELDGEVPMIDLSGTSSSSSANDNESSNEVM